MDRPNISHLKAKQLIMYKELILENGNITQAYMNTYKCKYETAHKNGSACMAKKKVVKKKKIDKKHVYKKKPNGKNATGRPTKLTESKDPVNLKYSRTMRGTLTNIFGGINRRCRRKGWEEVIKSDFYEWVEVNKTIFSDLYNKWKFSGYQKRFKPSVDRRDNDKQYIISNLQLITWEENDKKGKIECSKKVRQMDQNNNTIAVFPSYRKAMSETKIDHISHVCNGLRKTAGGYMWEYI